MRSFCLLPPSFCLGLALLSATAAAQLYPNRLVRIVVPQAAGGGVDIMARSVAQ